MSWTFEKTSAEIAAHLVATLRTCRDPVPGSANWADVPKAATRANSRRPDRKKPSQTPENPSSKEISKISSLKLRGPVLQLLGKQRL